MAAKLTNIGDIIVKGLDAGNHISTDWQYSEFPDFSVISQEFLNDTSNLETRVYNGPLFLNQAGDEEGIYCRIRYATNEELSQWSLPFYYSRPVPTAPVIDTPTILSVIATDGTKTISYTITTVDTTTSSSTAPTTITVTQPGIYVDSMVVSASAFNSVPLTTHTDTRWIIEDINNSSDYFEITTQDPFLTTIDLKSSLPGYPNGIPIKYNRTYRISVIYISDGNESLPGTINIDTKNCSDFRPNAGWSGTSTYIQSGTCLTAPTSSTSTSTTTSSTSTSESTTPTSTTSILTTPTSYTSTTTSSSSPSS